MSRLRGGHALALLFCICLLQQCAAQGAFLQEQLPLKVLVTTPTAIATAESLTAPAVTLTGRQALTVVFSRPVIALGSDWGSKELPPSLVPFTLSCGTPGRLRWVTTNIARFDPSVEWPTDLACTLNWNTELKTFDGAPLVLDGLSPSVKLTTQPLSITITSVTSDLANKATDGQWSATTGLPDDKLPEVPPGANITLSFSYPVELTLLAKALKVAGPGSAGQSISISPCSTAPPPVWPIIFTANGQTGGAASGASPADQLQLNSTCAVVKLVPGLAAGASAVLRLPAGAKYNSFAGPIVLDTDVQVYGLRRFRIPLSWEFINITDISQPIYNGVKYKRLTLWLPHGLASGTKLESIQPVIKVCNISTPFANSSACQNLQFTISRPTLGSLVMSVPALAPRQRYRVTVQGDDMVKDAFGLPLQSSANTWWTQDLDGAYQGPNLNQVALLESADGPLTWPWVSRGKPEDGVNKIQAWDFAVPGKAASNSDLARAIAGMSYSYAGTPSNAFGAADQTVTRPVSAAPTFQSLTLAGKPGVSFVGSCCRKMTWPTARDTFASTTLVVQSDLQAAFVQQDGKTVAWVTTTQGQSKPVTGAVVQVFLSAYNQDAASPGTSCTTGNDGTCMLEVVDTTDTFSNNQVKTAVVTATGHGALIVPSLSSYFGQNTADIKYSGAVVLDRQVVKPGDDLHVTAYFQRQSGTKLVVAKDVTSVILQINPPFDPAAPGGSTRITIPVDTTFGSAHAAIPVPANATAGTYTISVYTIDKSGQSSSNMPRPLPVVQPNSITVAAPMTAAGPEPESAAAVPADGVVPPKLPTEPVAIPGAYIAGTGFTIADPRPPTAALTIIAPNWVKPADSVRVNFKAESYVGSDVSGANITIAWETGKAKGTLEVSTNASGIATGVIELGKLPTANVSEPGDELKLTATWIGPTREPIIKSKTIRVADGPVRVELARTLETDVSGIPFGVKADTFSNEDDSPVTGVSVEVTLSPANGTSSLTNCTSEQIAALSSQRCSIKSGNTIAAASCQLNLPCMGEFQLKGCATVDGSSSCGAPIRVGRNATWWEASPWSSGPQIKILPDKLNVTLGGDVKLVVQNPWWGPTSGLLVWGNAVTKLTRTLPEVPRGVSTITISDIREECRGSCRVMLVLAIARPASPTAAAPKERRAFGLVPLARNILPFDIVVRTSTADTTSTAASNSSRSVNQITGQSSSSAAVDFNVPDIPTSKLFDPLAPRTVSAEVTLTGPQTEALEAEVDVQGEGRTADGTALFTPKTGKGSIYVTVKEGSGKAVAGAEVTVLVVDKAFLDLMPYPLQNVSTTIAPDMSTVFSLTELNAFRTSRAAINATFSTLQRRLLQLDPWLPVDTDVTPRSYYPGDYITPPSPAAVDVPDWKYLATFTTPITVLPYKPCSFGQICPAVGPSLMFGAAAPMMAAEAVASDALFAAPRAAPASNGMVPFAAVSKSAAATTVASSTQQTPVVDLRIEGDFKVTALFTTVKAGSDGRAAASFIAPDNLGQFVVRAYVAAPKPAAAAAPVDVVYGAAESQLLVRRQVSLTPSLPRQVRAGDNFTAGVLVESPGVTADTKVTVTAALVVAPSSSVNSSSLSSNGPTTVTVTLKPSSTQQEARFTFRARSIGIQNISFTAAAEGGAVADRVQLTVPVLGKQSPVWIATSFAVRGSNSSSVANRVEGLALPAAEAGSGSISLVAGVGYLPAVQGTYEALIRQGLNTYLDCPSGTNAVALSVMPSMISLYQTPGTAAGSYLTANQINTTLAALTQAATTLTDAKYGLLPQEPRCLYPNSPGPERADISLNAWAVWLVEQLDAVGSVAAASAAAIGGAGPQTDTKLTTAWGTLEAATKAWHKALEMQLVADAVAARAAQPPRVYDDYDTLSWARLVLGADWTPPGASSEISQDLSMQRLLTAVNNASLGLSVGIQARAGLALLQSQSPSKTASTDVKKIAQRLLSNVRVGGRTAYVATGDGDRGAAGLSDQSLALMLFIKSGTDNPLVQKIAAWVGQGAAPPPFRFSAVCINTSPWEAALRARGLSFYDQSTNSTTPSIALTAVAAPAASSSAAAAGLQQQQVQLLSARFNASNAGSVARSTRKWDVIPAGSQLVFNAKGMGEVSVAASLNFTPAELLPFPTYRGLWVQRIVQLSSATGGSIRGTGLGKMLTVAVQVTSPDDQSDVVVEVLMPGGLEPLDPNVFKDADVATICSSSEDESNLENPSSSNGVRGIVPLKRGGPAGMQMSVGPSVSFSPGFSGASNTIGSNVGFSSSSRYIGWWTPWPVCPQQTTMPSVVTFSFSYFRAGTQTIRFKAIAATSGVFSLPPVKAYVQRQPEVMGLSPAGVFTVCPTAAACPAAQQLLPADPAAKACPKDCSGNGACNLSSGVCICDSGFSGADCSLFGMA